MEQLRRNGVYVDENGRAVASERRSPLSSEGSEPVSQEMDPLREYMTPSTVVKDDIISIDVSVSQ